MSGRAMKSCSSKHSSIARPLIYKDILVKPFCAHSSQEFLNTQCKPCAVTQLLGFFIFAVPRNGDFSQCEAHCAKNYTAKEAYRRLRRNVNKRNRLFTRH